MTGSKFGYMDLVTQLGGNRSAAAPSGARGTIEAQHVAERYGNLLKVGEERRVLPMLEMWGGHPAHEKNSR